MGRYVPPPSLKEETMVRAVSAFLAVFSVVALPGQANAQAQNPVVQEIRQVINSSYDYTKENLRDQTGTYSENGSLEFWSSGGLAHNVAPDAPARTYESFNLVPKYIWVVSLSEDVAMAQFYVEGSYQQTGEAPVNNYFTRATQVFVKENGEWKVRAAHFSPVVGGSGTKDTAIIG
jgi:hypothetical protein